MEGIIIPISICVVLPVAIVLISAISRINADNKRSQVIIKAIEAKNEVDTDKIIESLKKPHKSSREILNARLQRGCMYTLIGLVLIIAGVILHGVEISDISLIIGGISIAIGVSYLITYFMTRNQSDPTQNA